MVEIDGVPAIMYMLEWLREQGVREVAINLNHHPQVLIDFVGDGKRFGLSVLYSIEPKILGTAGALNPLREFFAESGTFLVAYGDVLTDLVLTPMRELHETQLADLTMAVTHSADPTSAGIVAFDAEGRIQRFAEKPKAEHVFSEWENGGIYLCSPTVLEYVAGERPQDFGHDVIPAMLRDGRRLFGHASGSVFSDFGTPERLTRATTWAKGWRKGLSGKALAYPGQPGGSPRGGSTSGEG